MDTSEPAYALTLEERPGYLYAKVEADAITPPMAERYVGEILGKCRELKIRRVMLERNVPVMMAPADAFHTTQKIVDMFRGIKLAIINPFAELEQDLGFVTMVANNRGATMETHNSTELAEKWLLG